FLIDEGALQKLLSRLPDDSIVKLQAALDRVVIPEVLETKLREQRMEAEVEEAAPEAGSEAAEQPVEAETLPEPAAAVDEIPTAFGDEMETTFIEPESVIPSVKDQPRKPEIIYEEDFEDEEEDFELESPQPAQRKKKKDRQKRRQLVYDEKLGEVVARRRRKGRRSRDDWDDFLD